MAKLFSLGLNPCVVEACLFHASLSASDSGTDPALCPVDVLDPFRDRQPLIVESLGVGTEGLLVSVQRGQDRAVIVRRSGRSLEVLYKPRGQDVDPDEGRTATKERDER